MVIIMFARKYQLEETVDQISGMCSALEHGCIAREEAFARTPEINRLIDELSTSKELIRSANDELKKTISVFMASGLTVDALHTVLFENEAEIEALDELLLRVYSAKNFLENF